MITVSKYIFKEIAKFRPQWLIGKQIIYDTVTEQIYDVSISGDYIFIDNKNKGKGWVRADRVNDPVIIDTADIKDVHDAKFFSVSTITKSIENLENSVGHPDSEQSKSLFEIVTALNKELLELKLKINEMELKIKEQNNGQT